MRRHSWWFIGLLVAVLLLGSVTAASANGAWWDTNWAHRRKLTLDNSGVGEVLTDFPVLVCLDPSNITYSQTQNNGEDIRFVDPDGTVLKHEIEEWNEGGTSCVWVKVPQIDADPAVDYIWMYYGNAGVADGQDAENVWDTQFQGVWHLNRSSGDVLDSTSNDNDGTNVGSTRGVSGRIDSAFDFDGTDDYINVGDVGSDDWTAITVEAWIYHHAIGDERIICKSTGTDIDEHIFSLGVDHQTNRVVRARLGTDGTGGGISSHDSDSYVHEANRWEYVAFTWNSSDATIRFYSNGQAKGTASRDGDNIKDSSQVVSIGNVNAGDDDRYFDGLIDEPRISSTARSAEWIAAQYKSMTCGFIESFGDEESLGTIIVEKQTDPDGASGSFDFDDDIGDPLTFSLSDNGTQPFTDVVSGTYTITETNLAPAFDLTDITCSDGSPGNVGTGEATVSLQAGETVTCTFTNTYVPPVPVGGIVVPVSRLGLVAPWMGVAALAGLAALVVVVVRRRRG